VIGVHLQGLMAMILNEPTGQGWSQVTLLLIALALSSLIGLERDLGQKSAGIRTHALVGVGAALFMLVSKYGFTNVLIKGSVILDPSRVAAQIVTGIGFIGGGLIFVRRDAVQGLTTAAAVWVTAAIGAACGAGLPILAIVATVGHFLVARGYPRVTRRFGLSRFATSIIHVCYVDGQGLLRTILASTTTSGFSVTSIVTRSGRESTDSHYDSTRDGPLGRDPRNTVDVEIQIQGSPIVNNLVSTLSEIDGVVSVTTGRPQDFDE